MQSAAYLVYIGSKVALRGIHSFIHVGYLTRFCLDSLFKLMQIRTDRQRKLGITNNLILDNMLSKTKNSEFVGRTTTDSVCNLEKKNTICEEKNK